MEPIKFETLLIESTKLPIVNINREEFLKKELQGRYRPEVVEKAIQYNPAYAGICVEEINKIAESCIELEARRVTALSAAAGVPGGVMMVATVPTDLIQYYGHTLRVLQKLMYLYGWEELHLNSEELNDETMNLITLFFGVMYAVNGADSVVKKLTPLIAQQVIKELSKKKLTKTMIYPVVKIIGVKLTKELFAQGVSKIVPVIGAVVSGGMTFFSFKVMSGRLKKCLQSGQLANVEYYKSTGSESIIDVEVVDVTEDDIW